MKSRTMGAIGVLVMSYGAWLLLFYESLTGGILSELVHNPTLWLGLVACMAVCVTLMQSAPATRLIARATRFVKGWHVAALCSIMVFGATCYIAHDTFAMTPRVQDEMNYFFMGKMFASGHLWLEGLPARDFLTFRFFVTEERIYSLFQPGWPVLLALGHLIGAAWIMGPLCTAVATFLVYLVAKEIFDETHALWAVVMMSCGQAWWFQGASMMSHMCACMLGLAGITCALRAWRTVPERRVLLALCAGAFFGAMFTVRAGTAVALSVPVIGVGGYLVARRRLSWRVAAAFGAGLALTGSLQLLYNFLVSGHPLIFPQDHYFNITEPLERCHRLGVGPGIGCPYEHGPDLGPEGFTWARAWEVTRFRLDHFRWDMFGTGVALWMLPFLACSRRFWRQKLWLMACCGSVMGLYFFYYYHGNFYGVRYYFEVIPYVLMLLVSAWMSLIDLIGVVFSEVKNRWPERIMTAGVVAFVCCMPAHHLLEGFEKKRVFYSEAWTWFKDVDRAERSSTLDHAVIIMPNSPQAYWGGFAQNAADLAGPRIYVRDWGAAMNAQLLTYYPDRQFYRPTMAQGEMTFVPTTLPMTRDLITIEGEALFPVSRRSQGYAAPQSLSAWPGSGASRQEHLLFEKTEPGAWFTFEVYAGQAGEYGVQARLTTGPDYGVIRLVVNDTALEPSFDGFASEIKVKPWRGTQSVTLVEGRNTVTVEVVGKSELSRGFVAGLDQLTFTRLETE